MPNRQEELLVQAGFSGLEAAIYLTLLKESGLTGYRISKLAGKPVSNVYKALASLESKGAVISDGSGKSRLYSALPIAVYLDHREQVFSSGRKELESSLKDIAMPSVDYGVFKLEKVEQIMDLAEAMLTRAKRTVLVDCLPAPPKHIIKTLEKLARTGIEVVVQCVKDVKIKGCHVLSTVSARDAEHFPGVWFCIVADADEYLVSFVSSDYKKVYEAFWSKSPFLTLLMYNGLFHEFANRQTWSLLRKDTPIEDVKKFHERLGRTYMLMRPAICRLYEQHGLPLPEELSNSGDCSSDKGKKKRKKD